MTGKLGAWLILSLAAAAVNASTYTVRNGDNDWAIAHRAGISEKALHRMNPDVDWDSLQPGTKLTLPGDSPDGKVSRHHKSKTAHSPALGTYKVREDDNDWSIAAKLGITHEALKALNPHVRWTRLQPGQTLQIPGHAVAASRAKHISTRYAVITGENVTLRRGPSVDEEKVTSVDSGTRARVLDRDSGWYKLRFPKGTVAWVRGDFLTADRHHASNYASAESHHSRHHYVTRRRHGRTPEVAVAMNEIGQNQLLKTAYNYRGTRYRTGGTSRSGGFDCSGFTSTVYRLQGIKIPRTSHDQSQVGQRVDKTGLKKGDLVFFKTNRGIRINHVGIYIGNGKFIHSSSGGGQVQVNSLNEGYYNRRFAGARRVVKAQKKVATRTKVEHHASKSVAANPAPKTASTSSDPGSKNTAN